MRVVNAEQVRELLSPALLLPALERALMAQAAGKADVPPRIAARAPNGLSAAMPGYLEGVGLATKLVTVFPGNTELPSHMGLIAFFDPETGELVAILDAEVITEERTAGTAAIAAGLLARPDADVLTIVGAGAQGRAHLAAFGPIREWREIRIVSRTQPKGAVLAAQARFDFGAEVVIADDFDEFEPAVRGAGVIALCTHSDNRVIEAAWVDVGTHVSSVGSLAELPTDLVGIGPLVVDHIGAVTSPPPAGAVELQHVDPAAAVELGALLAGTAIGRADPGQITVYKSTGHAVQDIAATRVVFDSAVAAGIGTMIEL